MYRLWVVEIKKYFYFLISWSVPMNNLLILWKNFDESKSELLRRERKNLRSRLQSFVLVKKDTWAYQQRKSKTQERYWITIILHLTALHWLLLDTFISSQITYRPVWYLKDQVQIPNLELCLKYCCFQIIYISFKFLSAIETVNIIN